MSVCVFAWRVGLCVCGVLVRLGLWGCRWALYVGEGVSAARSCSCVGMLWSTEPRRGYWFGRIKWHTQRLGAAFAFGW